MVTIVDYGAGNLTSVKNAFAALGVETETVRDAKSVERAERVVFPGVGAAKSAMENLASLGLVDTVREAAASGKPFLGICLGMQILFERSDEDGGVDTLGVVPGRVRRFPDVPGFKVPEIGWNDVRVRGENAAELGPLVDGLEFYFVHSYYAEYPSEGRKNQVFSENNIPKYGRYFCSSIVSISAYSCSVIRRFASISAAIERAA